jgi:hypothetical protein
MGAKSDKLMESYGGRSNSDKLRILIIKYLEDMSSGGVSLATEATLLDLLNKVDDSLGGNGTEYINSAVTGKAYKYLVVNEDVVFSNLVDDASVDLLVNLNITTNTISKGMVIRANNGKLIKEVTPSSGSVIGVL